MCEERSKARASLNSNGFTGASATVVCALLFGVTQRHKRNLQCMARAHQNQSSRFSQPFVMHWLPFTVSALTYCVLSWELFSRLLVTASRARQFCLRTT